MGLKVSVIGSGRWGKNLVAKFSRLGVLHLVYGRSNREMLEGECGARFTDDISHLISNSDAVVVAAPPAEHFQLGKRVLKAGRDLFMEKPIALSLDETLELVEIADSKNRVMLVGHILCYGPGFETLAEVPGNPIRSVGYFLKTSSPEKLLNAYWNFGIHMIALAVALGVPEDGMEIIADDAAPVNRRTFRLETGESDGTIHEASWDFLDRRTQVDILMTECQHFVDCVRSRNAARTDGEHAIEVMNRLVKIAPEYTK